MISAVGGEASTMEEKSFFGYLWIFLKKIAAPITLIALIVLLVKEIPGVLAFLEWSFRNLGTNGQIIVMIIAGVAVIYFAVVQLSREDRIEDLKAKRRDLEEQLKEKDTEIRQIEEQNILLAEEGVKEDIWRRDVVGAPKFIDKRERKTRFISVLNLKGGVGKTTLAANLGATFALMERPLEVLLVDLDFQATLSNMSVEGSTLLAHGKTGQTSSRLLTVHLDPSIVRELFVDVNQVPKAKIIISDIGLERMNNEAHAKYFLNKELDVRFCYRSAFHHKELSDRFDVVFFDCPPRLTSSTINALTCSDYVLIPTKLDERSFEAIPRTLRFLGQLQAITQPKIIGVVANEVQYWRRPKLTKAHDRALADLRQRVRRIDPDMYIFRSLVELKSTIGGTRNHIIPSVDPAIREQLFLPLAWELRERIDQ
jgi:cellulose biosynthesis protein BcsQ/uncharacterized membrane protein